MEPADVFYSELLSENLSENNEIEEIKFKKSKNYAISGLAINQEVNSEFVPLPNVDA